LKHWIEVVVEVLDSVLTQPGAGLLWWNSK